MMTFGKYLKQSAGEYALLLLATWAVSTVGFNAFFLDEFAQNAGYAVRSGLGLLICAVLLLALYAAAYNRKRLLLGVVGYLVLLAVLVGVALALSNGGVYVDVSSGSILPPDQAAGGTFMPSTYADAEGNYLYYVAVLIFACTLGFLLTRTLVGSTLFFLGLAFCCTLVQAFYVSDEVAFSVIAALAGLALIVHRNFKLGLARADAARTPSHASGFAASVLPVGASAVLALMVWFVVLAPLNPATMKITLRTDYRTLPYEEAKGTVDQQPNFTYDLTSENLVEGPLYQTDDLFESPEATTTIDANSVLEQELQQQLKQSAAAGSGQRDALDPASTNAQFNAISWSEVFPSIIVIIALIALAILAIAGYFMGRRHWRTLRLVNMLNQDPRTQVQMMYRYELSRLNRLGFKVPAGMTLAEYATGSARAMDMITDRTRVHWTELTQTYQAVAYGNYVPSEDEIVPFVAYYHSFWQAARTHLGNLRYFFKAFRL